MKRFFFVTSYYFLMATLLGACTLPTIFKDDLHISMRQPEDGAVFSLGEINVAAGGILSNPRTTLREVIFYANGVLIGRDSAPTRDSAAVPTNYAGEIHWTPTESGEYVLQAQTSRPLTISAAHRICVIDFAIPPPVADDSWPYPFGYQGPCPIPGRDASAMPGAQSLSVATTPERLVYSPPDIVCPSSDSITFEAGLVDPPQDVAFVVVDISVTGTSSGFFPGQTFAYQLILTQTSTSSSGVKIFEGSIASSAYGGEFGLYLGNEPSEITWIARGIGRDGSEILSLGPGSIPAEPCMITGFSVPFASETPTLTSTLVLPTATFTPTSDKDCPPAPTSARSLTLAYPSQPLPQSRTRSRIMAATRASPIQKLADQLNTGHRPRAPVKSSSKNIDIT